MVEARSLDSLRDDVLPTGTIPVSHRDERSDKEILMALAKPPPVKSQKNVWAFWDKGLSHMRPWSQRNVIGWVRLLGPDWTVRVLDLVEGSASNVAHFTQARYLPACLNNGTMSGRYSGQHASDMVRLCCIYQHGGVWMDVGLMLFTHLDRVCWDRLQSSSSKFEVALASADPSLVSGLAENFFIAAPRGNAFIHRWLKVFLEVWKGRSDCHGIHQHPLFHHSVTRGNVGRFLQSASPDKLDYFSAYLAYERLRTLENPEDGFNGPNYCRNRILLLPYQEFASAAMLTHDDGNEQFTMLTTRYDRDFDTEDFVKARQFCQYMLSQTAMMKLYHWKEGNNVTLADLWDKPGNEKADMEVGTFAELLRYGSTHNTQQRELKALTFPISNEEILVAGLLESFDD